ncbi:hypothetical protein JCM15519_26580 [Fundidesulfovibrio butyratiphilus]
MPDTPSQKLFSINLPMCHGCGACAEIAPELFTMDPDADHPRQLVTEAPEEQIRQAMAYCPNDCIEIEGDA